MSENGYEFQRQSLMPCLHLGIYRGKRLLTKPWYICTVFILAQTVIKHDHDQIELAANSKTHA